MPPTNTITIQQAIERYLDSVKLARSENTARTYGNAMNAFAAVLKDEGLDVTNTSLEELQEDSIALFATALKGNAPATEQLYLTATAGFFEYLAAEQLAEPNLPRIRLLIRQRGRRPGPRLPQFPRDAIEQILTYVETLPAAPVEQPEERLRLLRDRAFVVTLADTGLRVHEACGLRRGDL
ncbi:MAG: site-specific integrase, partial [Chloroflexi bacterium]|nr:site-specific integrase [Chloroflexota bacterium]